MVQCVAVCCSVLQRVAAHHRAGLEAVNACCVCMNVLQCVESVALCCSAVQCVAVRCNVLLALFVLAAYVT